MLLFCGEDLVYEDNEGLLVFFVNSHTGLTIEILQFDFTSGDKNVCIATPNTLFFLSSLREMADIFLIHEAAFPSTCK